MSFVFVVTMERLGKVFDDCGIETDAFVVMVSLIVGAGKYVALPGERYVVLAAGTGGFVKFTDGAGEYVALPGER